MCSNEKETGDGFLKSNEFDWKQTELYHMKKYPGLIQTVKFKTHSALTLTLLKY